MRLGVFARVLFFFVCGVAPACRRDPAPTYNVLLISLDTVRQDMIGSYGHRPRRAPDVAITPALDRLARDGVRMVDAYSSSAWTLPAHLSLLTGEPPLVHGVETEVGTLPASFPTLAEILKRHGYATYGIYSAPYLEPHWGFGRGFDRYDAVYGTELFAASQHAIDLRVAIEQAAAAHDWPRYDDLKAQEVGVVHELNQRSEEAITSDDITARVLARLNELARETRPWFVFAHFFDPHCDYIPPTPYDTRFDPDYNGSANGRGCLNGEWVGREDPARPGAKIRVINDRDLDHVLALYEGEIAWVDAHVGKILDTLDSLDLTRTTLVVVTSDHGEEFFEHGGLGHRHTLHEEVTRVPLLLRLPSMLPADRAISGPVSLTDVPATVLDILGIDQDKAGSGESFLPLIRGTVAGSARSALTRVVTMYGGEVVIDANDRFPVRQILIQDAFRLGAIKVTRTRSWPQFPTTLSPELRTATRSAAAEQYQREERTWIDVARFPTEPDAQQSSQFADPRAQHALEEFRQRYDTLRRQRQHQTAPPLPQNVRDTLERLGYGDTGDNAAFPEPDIVLPPPGG